MTLSEDAPRERFRTATRRALESLVTLCIEEVHLATELKSGNLTIDPSLWLLLPSPVRIKESLWDTL